eukprot:TRINITY_DN11403_c0_g1_i1.p1 TRINITY_DN11403_c0_g1~~TRINITY_DN11403_c0_g1_i1.p1  ORF type:complete len:439 (+),score=85.75 TRINITY_DN11403_c0_g1_i1:55-1317(+)
MSSSTTTLFTCLLVVLTTPCLSQEGEGSGWPEWPPWPAWVESTGPGDDEIDVMVDVTPGVASVEAVSVVTTTPIIFAGPTTEISEAAVVIDMSFEEFDSVAQFLNSREDLSLFMQIAEAAGILEALSFDYRATIFVPTNDAIAAALELLGFSSVDDFIDNWLKVYNIVNYHIIFNTQLFSVDLEDEEFLVTNAAPLLNVQVDLSDGVSILGMADEAKVTEADIIAGNSVIHIIDTVLFPFDPTIAKEVNEAWMQLGQQFASIGEIIENVPSLSTFGAVVEATDMSPLSQPNSFQGMIFIPTNSAFESLLSHLEVDSLDDLAKDQDLLLTILQTHLVPTSFYLQDLENDQQLTTVGDETLSVNGVPFLTVASDGAAAWILYFDILVGDQDVNVFIIDDVLLPWEVTDEILQQVQDVVNMDN